MRVRDTTVVPYHYPDATHRMSIVSCVSCLELVSKQEVVVGMDTKELKVERCATRDFIFCMFCIIPNSVTYLSNYKCYVCLILDANKTCYAAVARQQRPWFHYTKWPSSFFSHSKDELWFVCFVSELRITVKFFSLCNMLLQ
jgi:hypothetical protein